jgi:glutaredoxin
LKIKVRYIIPAVAVIVVGVVALSSFSINDVSGRYDMFAQCLTDNGVSMYGAFWCPHCKEQKEMFGSSAKYVDYVECSTPDRSDQTQICKDANIDGYPTWILQDGTRIEGKTSLEILSEKSDCPLNN